MREWPLSAVMLIGNAQYTPFVTPAQAGVQLTMESLKLDSGFSPE
jgi:hypothetical protein